MRRAVAIVVLVLAAGMVSVQVASADVFVGHTNLTIHVEGSNVSGKLVGRPECRPNQTIELWVDGALQASTPTDGSGNYSFTGSFSSGSTVQTRFGGSQTGVHPNRFVCTPALSRLVVAKEHGAGNTASLNSTAFAGLSVSRARLPMPATGSVLARLPLRSAL